MAEALAEEDLRRRDPVKRAIFVGSFLVALSLVWFSSTWLEYMMAKKGLTTVQEQIQSRTNEFAQVQFDLKKIADTQKRLDSLQKLATTRFLQGNLMNALQQLYIPSVQLTRLRIEQNYVLNPGSPPITNSFGVVPGRPSTAVERILLTVDAKDFSANAGDQVNRFKSALVKQDYFKTTIDVTNGVRLASLSPPQSSYDSKPYVMFTLECRFPDQPR